MVQQFCKDYVYLDYNATAPLHPAVHEVMIDLLSETGNPSSIHKLGRRSRYLVTQARHGIGQYIDADPEYIIFTAGGSEANNLALQGVNWEHIIMSPLEHDSIYKAPLSAELLAVDDQGLIHLSDLEAKLQAARDKKTLVSVIWANNETGVIQPMEEIVSIAHKYGAYVHADAVQMMGKKEFSFSKSMLDMMTVSAHKFGGPQGVGALVAKESIPLTALIRGGGQEKNRRAGTENVAAIGGFAAALAHTPSLEHLYPWHQEMEEDIQAFAGHEAYVFSQKSPRLPNTTCLVMPYIPNATQVMNFDLEGFAISAGSACSSGRVQVSRVLKSIVQDDLKAISAIRISSGWKTTHQDLIHFAETWKKLYQRHASSQKGLL
jgi:cysteine desulfurase